MDIRFANPNDTDGILELLRQVGQVHHEGRPDIFRAGAQKYNARQVQELMKQVLGYCFCFVKKHENDSVLCDRTELYIDDLCIDQKQRGTGIGKSLYEAACSYAKERSFHSVTLNVWCCNPGAMAFYEKLGMKPQKIGMENVL